jgi:cellulose synthase/poly-beta-1,6-N-acetylglucosamine synthase-like glycosyltransferase
MLVRLLVAVLSLASFCVGNTIVYWDGDGATWDGLADSPYDIVVLSFAQFTMQGGQDSGIIGEGNLFDFSLPYFASKSGIKSLQAKGKRVLVSLGGGDKKITPTEYKLAPRVFTELFYLDQQSPPHDSASRFAQAVKAFVVSNGLDGVDLDNEENFVRSASSGKYRTGKYAEEILTTKAGVDYFAKLVIALRAALDSISGLQIQPMLTMTIQPTGWVPHFKEIGPQRLQLNDVQLDEHGNCNSSTKSCFPIADAGLYPDQCSSSACFFQYFMVSGVLLSAGQKTFYLPPHLQYMVQISPAAIQSLDYVINMLYPVGNLYHWVDKNGSGYPQFTDPHPTSWGDPTGTANLFSIYDSVVQYIPSEPNGVLNRSQMLLGIQIEEPPAPGVPPDASWVNASQFRAQFAARNGSIGGLSLWAGTELCEIVGNDYSKMIIEEKICSRCPKTGVFKPMSCPVPGNPFVNEMLNLLAVALLLLCSALGGYLAGNAASAREAARTSKPLPSLSKGNSTSNVCVSNDNGKALRLQILGQGLLTKNCEVVLHSTKTLAELKEQIWQQLGLEGVKDFDILATDKETKESNKVVESFVDLNDRSILMLQDNQDFSTTGTKVPVPQGRAFNRSLGSMAKTLVQPLRQGEWEHTQDKTPAEFKGYFRRPLTTKKMIAVGIAAYNEEAYTLERTLQSLHDGFAYKLGRKDFTLMQSVPESPATHESMGGMTSGLGYYMSVLILIDGVDVMSSSMGEYLEELFGVNVSDLDQAGSCTSICERTRDQTSRSSPGRPRHSSELSRSNPNSGANAAPFHPDVTQRFPLLHLYLLVKMDNRKKHNSHEWLLKAFAQNVNATYVLCTDTGTVFERKCVKELVKFLEQNPRVSGATGTQVVMTPKMQTEPGQSLESCLSIDYFLRSVQGYEYDITHCIDKSAFSAAGFMPVLPGPCGMFRMSSIRGLCCERYFDFVHQTPTQLGLMGSNLCLAEDRVLTLESVCSSDNGKGRSFSKWVPVSALMPHLYTAIRVSDSLHPTARKRPSSSRPRPSSRCSSSSVGGGRTAHLRVGCGSSSTTTSCGARRTRSVTSSSAPRSSSQSFSSRACSCSRQRCGPLVSTSRFRRWRTTRPSRPRKSGSTPHSTLRSPFMACSMWRLLPTTSNTPTRMCCGTRSSSRTRASSSRCCPRGSWS